MPDFKLVPSTFGAGTDCKAGTNLKACPKLKAGIRFRWYQEQGWYPLQICCQPKS